MKKNKAIKKSNKSSKISVLMKNIKSNKKNKPKNTKKRNIGEKILVFCMIGLIATTSLAVAFMIFVIIGSPTFSEEKLYSRESSIIYYIDGTEIARLGTENRELVSYDDLPEVLIDAIIATEDSRFMQHSGVDMARFLKASFSQLLGNSDAGGASTLTMQIVKQKLTDSNASGIKGIIRKFTDVYMAVFKIEKKYTKEQIIEFYVNTPYLGGGAHGIEQASQIYFDKHVGDVTLTEAAILAGLFQAPSAFDPYNHPDKAEVRRDQVLKLMKRHGYITDEEFELATSISVTSLLSKDEIGLSENQGMIDTVVEEVKERTDKDPYLISMKIYSTFNKEKQEVVNNINSGTSYKWANEALQTGIAVIDVKTGAISAIGAGRNKKRELGFNFATSGNRHPGSTAKPLFAYGPAFEYLNWGTGQMIIDDYHTYSNGVSIRNWDNSFKGIMTAKTALASSRNIPTLQAFQAVPQRSINEFVTGLGLKPEYDETGFINEGHSIGGYNGTNPVELAAAYSAFARGGTYIEPHSFTKIDFVNTGESYTVTPEKRTVMKDSTAFMINNILRYAVTNGYVPATNKSGTDVCGKTGTSTVDNAAKKQLGLSGDIIGDSWQVVYSPDYVIATWIGYENLITKEYYLTNSVGSSARNAISKNLSNGILETNSRFKQPSSVVTANIELETNPLQLASDFTPSNLRSSEYFRKGTAPSEVSTRFSKLEAPTDLTATYENGTATLNWKPIEVPSAIGNDTLAEYFNEGFGKWANKYLNNRINYNNSNIGSIGYQVYLNNGTELKDLGWTGANTFTYKEALNGKATFIVKSSYSIFKSNMSDEIAKSIETSSVEPITASLTGEQCITVELAKAWNGNNQNYIKVFDSGIDVTKNASVELQCYDSTNTKTNCLVLDKTKTYTGKPSILYKLKPVSNTLTLNIQPTCP